MPNPTEPNSDPTTYPTDQPAKEPPYGGEHLPSAARSDEETTLSDR